MRFLRYGGSQKVPITLTWYTYIIFFDILQFAYLGSSKKVKENIEAKNKIQVNSVMKVPQNTYLTVSNIRPLKWVHTTKLIVKRCNTVWHIAAHCSTLQHTATHCNTLQHAVTHCNPLLHCSTQCDTMQLIATHCNTLQHTATHYNTLQHITTHSNTL